MEVERNRIQTNPVFCSVPQDRFRMQQIMFKTVVRTIPRKQEEGLSPFCGIRPEGCESIGVPEGHELISASSTMFSV